MHPSDALSRDSIAQMETHLERAVDALTRLQRPDGHWRGELEGDSILQSEYLLMKWILAQESAPLADGSSADLLQRMVAYLRSQQRGDGSWGAYPDAPMDLSATVKAYFCLKLFGDAPSDPHMQRACARIRQAGGAESCNSFTNFYLAALGQISWDAVPCIPPEIIDLPKWCFFHLEKVSAWSRTMILPLAIVSMRRPTRVLPSALCIDELFVDHVARHRMKATRRIKGAWGARFLKVDRLLKWAHRFGPFAWRQGSVNRAFAWMHARAGQDGAAATDGLGAIFPPMVYWQIVLHAMGYARSDPLVVRAERDLDALIVRVGVGPEAPLRVQPCFSPVWDTGIALSALADCGFDATDEVVQRASAWLRSKECMHRGDWASNLHADGHPSGWCFEYNNAFYPDCDDTAMVAMSLYRTGDLHAKAASSRGVAWLLKMQNDDGGWAAFDRTEHRPILECVPFADHNAMQDPSCPDITGRVLECFAWHGMHAEHASVRDAIAYITAHQQVDGSFFGRWGVHYLYGTWQAVIGPLRCGVSASEPWVQRAGAWVKSVQKSDGSFGESCAAYDNASRKGQGVSTASQTAWGAMLLLEVFGKDDVDARRAIEWLCRTQLDDASAMDPITNPDSDASGSWSEAAFTGTGFPRVFYLRYHLYRLYFPIMAIGRFLGAHGAGISGKRLKDRGVRAALFG